MFDADKDQPVAIGLAALAGFVDAVGFLWLGGIFLSFMTGNSTRLGTELPGPAWAQAGVPAGIIALFVSGVVAASLLRRVVRRVRPAVMALVSVLLLAASALQATGHTTLAIVAATVAMGAENAVFGHHGEVSVGLTYMTGTLVKMGQHIASALAGGPALGWLPHMLRWLGMLGGAVAGSAVYQRAGLDALWVAAAYAACLTWVTVLWPGPSAMSAARSGAGPRGGHG